jgi:low temperature requirement protein LtrA
MTRSRGADLLRKPGQPPRATFLELFFDLVFLFALTRISARLVQGFTAEREAPLAEAGQARLLLLAVWSVWLATALITDLYDPQRPEIQLLVVATMFGSLVMAVALPGAFGAQGLAFAGAYVAVHIGRGLFFVTALRRHEAQRRAARVLFWFGVSAVPWIAGALVSQPAIRGALWALAVTVDYTASLIGLPAPGLGRASPADLPIVAEHLAERYRQFIIVALAEPILIIGMQYGEGSFPAGRTVAFVLAFAATVLLWRIYIYRAGQLLGAAIDAARQPARLALWSSGAHLLMVAGIIIIAVGAELVIDHPLGASEPAWSAVILGGPVLFTAGRAMFEYGVFGRVSRSRLIGVLLLAVLAPATVLGPPLAAAVVATLVLAGIAVSDAARTRGRPPEQPSPP